jgi:hypothetical protein
MTTKKEQLIPPQSGQDSPHNERPTIALESQDTDDLKKFLAEDELVQPVRRNQVPRYSIDFRPRAGRAPSRPVYFSDYHQLLLKMGMARFRAAFPSPFLAGIGTVGVLSSGSATTKDNTTEVFLGDLKQEPENNPALGGRVWALAPAEDRRQSKNFTLGRSMVNDVVIPEFAISRKHCSFSVDGRALIIEDLGSRNGTIISGHILAPGEQHSLKNLDMIILGRFTFQLFSPGGMTKALYEWETP